MNEDPLPCPKCGSTCLGIFHMTYIGDTGTHHSCFYVECTCGYHDPNDNYGTPEQAKDGWNEMRRKDGR